jgi:hypothetical protein
LESCSAKMPVWQARPEPLQKTPSSKLNSLIASVRFLAVSMRRELLGMCKHRVGRKVAADRQIIAGEGHEASGDQRRVPTPAFRPMADGLTWRKKKGDLRKSPVSRVADPRKANLAAPRSFRLGLISGCGDQGQALSELSLPLARSQLAFSVLLRARPGSKRSAQRWCRRS